MLTKVVFGLLKLQLLRLPASSLPFPFFHLPSCLLRLVLEEGSGMKAGTDFYLAYSPEREDPGRDNASVKTIPQVVGGYTEKCAELAGALYAQALDKIHRVSSCRAAEATKLLENIFRSINIFFATE